QFNTTSSMGRLTLNILLSFAQFEREIISERTRDKIGAMRRKGKYWGGHPVLGYDVERSAGGSRMVINPQEAARVRRLFELYREHQAMMPVVAEAQRLGWTNKVWTTKAGTVRGGGPIDKAILWRILTNVTYTGHVAHKGEVYDGEQEAIIEPDLWQAVQAMLARNSRSGGHGPDGTRRDDALLRGLLICQACGCAMMPTYTVKTTSDGAKKRYRYYTCHRANKRGKAKCPCPTLPAGEIEQFVVDEIAGIGRDPDIRDRVLAEAGERLAEEGNGAPLDHRAATAALAEFDHLWQALSPGEQRQLIQLLVERVTFDATQGRVSITFRPTGIATLGAPEADDVEQPEPDLQEAAA
ncbi:MAG: recombinase zinc beta ribbon domain-containing protein, partial [Phycisphaeraceae bacterium]